MSKVSLVILILWASKGMGQAQGEDPNARMRPDGAGVVINCPDGTCDDWANSSNSKTLKRSKADSDALKKAIENKHDLQKEDIELTDEEKQQAMLNQQLKGMNRPVSKELPKQSVSDKIKSGMKIDRVKVKLNKRGFKAVGEF